MVKIITCDYGILNKKLFECLPTIAGPDAIQAPVKKPERAANRIVLALSCRAIR